jgi:hypothetical protein
MFSDQVSFLKKVMVPFHSPRYRCCSFQPLSGRREVQHGYTRSPKRSPSSLEVIKTFFLRRRRPVVVSYSVGPGNTKGGSIIVLLTSCLTGLDQSVLQIKTKIGSCHTADSKPVKQEINGTVILLPL